MNNYDNEQKHIYRDVEDEKKLKDRDDDENKLRDRDVEDEKNLKTKTMMRRN